MLGVPATIELCEGVKSGVGDSAPGSIGSDSVRSFRGCPSEIYECPILREGSHLGVSPDENRMHHTAIPIERDGILTEELPNAEP